MSRRKWLPCGHPVPIALPVQVASSLARDDYQVGLREIIDAKIEGREIVAPEVEAPPKVVNLMDALRKSLDSIGATRKKPAAPVERVAAPKKRAGLRG